MTDSDYVLWTRQGLKYYGSSDLLAQVADEIQRNPSSCFTLNLLAWYNATYVGNPDVDDCSYQTKINDQLCKDKPPATPTEVVNIITRFLQDKNRAAAQSLLLLIYRQSLRQIIASRAPNVP